jgi:hypothetical protein
MPPLFNSFIFSSFYDFKPLGASMMMPSPESDQNINTALFLMASLSPKVREMIDLELYRQTADSDASTEQYILDSALGEFVKDIDSIGLALDIDYGHLSEDLPKLFQLIHLAGYLLPNGLYSVIKANGLVADCIRHVLDGSIGDNHTAIQTYLSELGGLDGQEALLPDLTDFIDEIYSSLSQTEVFTDYLRNLLDLVSQEKLVVESDSESHTAYRNHIKEIIARQSDAVNSFSQHPAYERLCRIQKCCINDLTAPSNFIAYNYIFTTPVETIPDDLLESYKRRWYQYYVSHSWGLDYFGIRKLTPTDTQIMMLYIFAYATCSTRSEYDSRAQALRHAYPSPETETQILALYSE